MWLQTSGSLATTSIVHTRYSLVLASGAIDALFGLDLSSKTYFYNCEISCLRVGSFVHRAVQFYKPWILGNTGHLCKYGGETNAMCIIKIHAPSWLHVTFQKSKFWSTYIIKYSIVKDSTGDLIVENWKSKKVP